MLEQGQSPVDDTDLTSSSPTFPAPLCRQFWNAGNYEDGLGSKTTLQSGKNYLHVHPMFLHSNATSHKWAFGAVAELLDNAVDEIQNGATFVILDKTSNPKDGSPSLLIQDDGGGMDPEAMRHCMSFGFSDKKSKSAIGQYGNGFKTSTMRLGADVIVFSRHQNDRILTQSIGMLSYTFLSQTGHDRIVVPMVDYQTNTLTGELEKLHRYGIEYYTSNMSMLLQWSPYSSEAELLKQFNDIGSHGTKVVIYNLWLNNDGNVELDFDTDPEDIRIGGETKKVLQEQHIANRYHYSLRVYLSILYLRVPESFRIILRGKVVDYYNIANELKHRDFIKYQPHSDGAVEGTVITAIGFLKEAPHINVHGFNVYHKNRLILPYWQVVSYSDSRGRGVVGVLEANFIEPTHNKQDFERTSLFQKLEGRLKEMTWEFWDFNCIKIGYQPKKKRPSLAPVVSSYSKPNSVIEQPIVLNQNFAAVGGQKTMPVGGALSMPNSHTRSEAGLHMKRKEHPDLREHQKVKKQAGCLKADIVSDAQLQLANSTVNHLKDQETMTLLLENKKLKENCLKHEKVEKELFLKATQLRTEVEDVNRECTQLLTKLKALHTLKKEKAQYIIKFSAP